MLVAASIPAVCRLSIAVDWFCFLLPKQFSFRSGKSCFSAAVNEKPIDRSSGSNFPALSVGTHTHKHTYRDTHTHTHTVAVSFWHSLRRVAFHFNAKLMTLTLVHLPPPHHSSTLHHCPSTQPWPRWHFSSFHYALIFRLLSVVCCLLCAWVACLAYRTLQWPTRSAHTHTRT